MGLVGIIANPAAGKDVRRLVAPCSVVDNNEKVNIVRRVLIGLAAAGVERVAYMPDTFAIVPRALEGLRVRLRAEPLALALTASEEDSARAAALLQAAGATCLVTLGGDGTNRAVARGCGTVPLVPISTGTNNAFPLMVEGTAAGLAAGLVATGQVPLAEVVRPTKRLEVWQDGRLLDIALVDVALTAQPFVGARALWEPEDLRRVVLSRAMPGSVGLSSLGAHLCPVDEAAPWGLAVDLGPEGEPVTMVLSPGLIVAVPVVAWRRLPLGDSVDLAGGPATLALDGERTWRLRPGETVTVRLTDRGPRRVAVDRVLALAAQRGLLRRLTLPRDGREPAPAD